MKEKLNTLFNFGSFKNKQTHLYLIFCFALVLFDQFSKYLALLVFKSQPGFTFLGFAFYPPVKNYNLIFGFNFNMDPLLMGTLLSAFFFLFFFYYIIFIIFVPQSMEKLKIGGTALFGGFAGNLINKLLIGYNLDFIGWSLFGINPVYFNLADIIQTIGLIMVIYQMIVLRNEIWRPKDKRARIFITNYQAQFVTYSVLAFLCLSFFFMILNYQFIGLVDFSDFSNLKEINSYFIKYSIVLLICLCFVISTFFIYISNKFYGPVYAFERYIKALLSGENPKDLKLREGDQLKNLEGLARDLKTRLKKHADDQV